MESFSKKFPGSGKASLLPAMGGNSLVHGYAQWKEEAQVRFTSPYILEVQSFTFLQE